eukprot:CAMPEP_0113955478 /NCGR_PEP_ID=MMETSP0011_2-20120614/1368_1 /TAXON_ID=101924 /ORGANISM="Rhodosorus marinus" /LENGTH=131 /DNA_ID=CAMNT_0000965197 /DNA_START=18 /DNA_END=412 /DNA_ORIENTATION=- /assembly_acc=CAM_ASM_000156
MVRWLNTFIEDAKVVERGLIQVLGIGQARTKTLCRAVGIAPTTKVGDLRPWHWDQMAKEIHTRGWSIQEELKKEVYDNIVETAKNEAQKGIPPRLSAPNERPADEMARQPSKTSWKQGRKDGHATRKSGGI